MLRSKLLAAALPMRTRVVFAWALSASCGALIGCGAVEDSDAGTAEDAAPRAAAADVSDVDDGCGAPLEQSLDAPWAVPPTGQRCCYDGGQRVDCAGVDCGDGANAALCGQDAQRGGNSRQFVSETVDGDAVVHDSLTGLVWQSDALDGVTAQEATDHCSGLDFAGESDWRVPEIQELATLIDYGRYAPASNFPAMIPDSYWSSNVDLNEPFLPWLADFSFGALRRQTNADDTRPVRCVQGQMPTWPGERYSISGDSGQEVMRDQATGLQWQQTLDDASAHLRWEAAIEHCEQLEYGGHDDWRLPNIQELRGLLDYTHAQPASAVPGMIADYFWSSSTTYAYPQTAWHIHSHMGSLLYAHKSFSDINGEDFGMGAKCIRTPEAQ